MKKILLIFSFFASFVMAEDSSTPKCVNPNSACALPSHANIGGAFPVTHSDNEWRLILAPEQYRILRQQGTEPAFNNAFHDNKAHGEYICAGCDQLLFRSEDKFDSGTGWPSFSRLANPNAVGITFDRSFGMERIEVHCSNCGGHLGHLFNDGPAPTGLRYCMNSGAMKFIPTVVQPPPAPQSPTPIAPDRPLW